VRILSADAVISSAINKKVEKRVKTESYGYAL
jgi:hypothetical protein